jgi:hypothetical protein
MASATDIINKALLKIGEKRITSQGFADPGNERERIASEHYEPLRDAELRKNRWNFAMKRAELSADATAPEFGYSARYALPADCLRIVEVVDLMEPGGYQIESGFILTNEEDGIQVRYIRRVTVVNDMDDLFRDALACRIALEFCDRLTQKRSKRQEVITEYQAFMATAASVDAIENPPEEIPESSFVTVRA